MGLLAKAAVKAATESAEQQAAKSAKGAVRKAEASAVATAHNTGKANPAGSVSNERVNKGKYSDAATGNTDGNKMREYTEHPPEGRIENKAKFASPYLGGGVIMLLIAAVALSLASYRMSRGLYRRFSNSIRS